MFKRDKLQEAITVHKLYLDTHPHSSRVAFTLARAFHENGDVAMAVKYYKKSLQLLPVDPDLSEFSRHFIESNVTRLLSELSAS